MEAASSHAIKVFDSLSIYNMPFIFRLKKNSRKSGTKFRYYGVYLFMSFLNVLHTLGGILLLKASLDKDSKIGAGSIFFTLMVTMVGTCNVVYCQVMYAEEERMAWIFTVLGK